MHYEFHVMLNKVKPCLGHVTRVTMNFIVAYYIAILLFSLICYAASTFDHVLEPLYLQLTHTPEDKRNQALVDSMMRKFSICANVLSQHLSDKQYICGDKFTAADCIYHWVQRVVGFGGPGRGAAGGLPRAKGLPRQAQS